jgi:hypothetical protein
VIYVQLVVFTGALDQHLLLIAFNV